LVIVSIKSAVISGYTRSHYVHTLCLRSPPESVEVDTLRLRSSKAEVLRAFARTEGGTE